MGFIARAIGRQLMKSVDQSAGTPEGRAAIERVRRSMALVTTTKEIAASGVDDQAACAKLHGRLPDDPVLVQEAIKHLEQVRDSYLDDRAYRLLTAAATGDPVRRIDPAVRGQFLEEAHLGRMPLSEAFEYLAALEPRLRDIPLANPPDPHLLDGQAWAVSTKPDPSQEAQAKLVGPFAGNPHAILNTDLAQAVVGTYLRVAARGPIVGDSTPFYERGDRVRTGTFFTIGIKGPRASN